MANDFTVQVKGLDKVIKDIAKRYDPKEANKKVTAALYEAATAIAVPAIKAQVPDGAQAEPPSPWRRGRKVKRVGPMSKHVRVKKLKPRINEYGAVHIGIDTSYSTAVIRGTKPHDIPNFMGSGQTRRHPGAKSNDILGRAMSSGTEKAMVDRAVTLITRL